MSESGQTWGVPFRTSLQSDRKPPPRTPPLSRRHTDGVLRQLNPISLCSPAALQAAGEVHASQGWATHGSRNRLPPQSHPSGQGRGPCGRDSSPAYAMALPEELSTGSAARTPVPCSP